MLANGDPSSFAGRALAYETCGFSSPLPPALAVGRGTFERSSNGGGGGTTPIINRDPSTSRNLARKFRLDARHNGINCQVAGARKPPTPDPSPQEGEGSALPSP